MNNIIVDISKDKYLKSGIIYASCVVILGSIANYFEAYIEANGWLSAITKFVLWTCLYLPIIYLMRKRRWGIKSFGINITLRSIAVSAILLMLFYPAMQLKSMEVLKISTLLTEGFARTGEEIFFRGFIYLLALRLTANRDNPGFWAIVLSSAVFAMVHTQPGREIAGFSLFVNTMLCFGIPRWAADSILPCVILHTFANASLGASLVGIIIVIIFALIGHSRGEVTIDLSLKSLKRAPKNKEFATHNSQQEEYI